MTNTTETHEEKMNREYRERELQKLRDRKALALRIVWWGLLTVALAYAVTVGVWRHVEGLGWGTGSGALGIFFGLLTLVVGIVSLLARSDD